MKRHTFLFNLIAVVVLAVTMVVSPASAGNLLASVPEAVGYSDFSYGTAVKPEPTAEVPESKLWWNDGRWWGVLFDPSSKLNTIYWFDWGNRTWVKTNTTLDSRIDDSGEVATRFDALWDNGAKKLYLASHIKLDNPSAVLTLENYGRLYRYSYQSSSKTYQLDSEYSSGSSPIGVNKDKTKTLVLEKDADGRLWVTYVSRPNSASDYRVYVNYTTGTSLGSNHVWNANPLDLSSIPAIGNNAIVTRDDISSVIAFQDAGGKKVGVLYSNERAGVDSFFWAETPVDDSPATGWTVRKIDLPGLTANDHIKLARHNNGTVYAVIKTDKTPGVDPATDPLIGVLVRNASNGNFSFLMISNVASLDTRPTMVLNESENKLYVFVTSNEAGGVICVNTISLSNHQLTGGNCSSGGGSPAPHFIASATYTSIDNATTTKQNITGKTGLVVLASEDANHIYLHNSIPPLEKVTYLPFITR